MIRVWRAKAPPAGGCVKRRYATWEDALWALIRIQRNSDRRVPKKHRYREKAAYRCDFCGAWHLTSKSRRRA